jgi:hypothetical protein
VNQIITKAISNIRFHLLEPLLNNNNFTTNMEIKMPMAKSTTSTSITTKLQEASKDLLMKKQLIMFTTGIFNS